MHNETHDAKPTTLALNKAETVRVVSMVFEITAEYGQLCCFFLHIDCQTLDVRLNKRKATSARYFKKSCQFCLLTH